MISRDYYVVLGVTRGESQRGIRDAYHDLALRFHPDRAGEQETERFQKIVEAYEVLSDPQARHSYDLGLARAERQVRAAPPTPAEPLLPEAVSMLRDFRGARHSLEEILERVERNFNGLGSPKSEMAAPLDYTLALSPIEAARGGLLRFEVPLYLPCPACHGSRASWPFVCACCRGHGAVLRSEQVALQVPPMIADGTTFEVPLHDLGIRNTFLRIETRIG
jgi:DnaJ-class molecular chaperone